MVYRLLLILGLCVSTAAGQDFQSFINRIYALPDNQRTPVVDSLMAVVPGFPFVEYDTLAHFLFRGNYTTVTIPGDANNWSATGLPMNRVSGTDFWYFTKTFEADARLDYKFLTNGSGWILDPRNPFMVMGGFGPNSELRMAHYQPYPGITFDPSIPHGKLRDTVISSAALGNSRTVRVYTPPGYDSVAGSYPIILFHDGPDYITLGQANNTLDYLIAHNAIQPVVALFVPANAANRHEEYAASLIVPFSSFIVNDVMGWASKRYRIRPGAESAAVIGSSDGGDISLYLGLNYPSVFGNIAAQSSNIISPVSNGFRDGPKLNLKFYLDLGTYDNPILIPLVRNFIPILQAKGYPYLYYEYHEGHSWGNWRDHVANALLYFFPAVPTSVRGDAGIPGGYGLEQNHPNPTNPVSTIAFTVPFAQHAVLKLYDVTGREVMTLFDSIAQAGRHAVRIDGSGLASGIYFYTLRAEGFLGTKKMLILR